MGLFILLNVINSVTLGGNVLLADAECCNIVTFVSFFLSAQEERALLSSTRLPV